ncbi:hypothetical protein PPERSA_00556 [Pseudocohnilembus persalinus]|uniref:Uncharacterized protein n=1 Tax=Pseudocohnilembus persalinus TaxID=266149 RepID=A0A0V0QST6_PSEPJ|nr:hypothetical protein PPERSA_00556 [Pseudocohnilembus persalinus]|eukprot:KRX05255.1 hypothetical protein PPERSA_00556 [Pseudocohnilembus persalinus]
MQDLNPGNHIFHDKSKTPKILRDIKSGELQKIEIQNFYDKQEKQQKNQTQYKFINDDNSTSKPRYQEIQNQLYDIQNKYENKRPIKSAAIRNLSNQNFSQKNKILANDINKRQKTATLSEKKNNPRNMSISRQQKFQENQNQFNQNQNNKKGANTNFRIKKQQLFPNKNKASQKIQSEVNPEQFLASLQSEKTHLNLDVIDNYRSQQYFLNFGQSEKQQNNTNFKIDISEPVTQYQKSFISQEKQTESEKQFVIQNQEYKDQKLEEKQEIRKSSKKFTKQKNQDQNLNQNEKNFQSNGKLSAQYKIYAQKENQDNSTNNNNNNKLQKIQIVQKAIRKNTQNNQQNSQAPNNNNYNNNIAQEIAQPPFKPVPIWTPVNSPLKKIRPSKISNFSNYTKSVIDTKSETNDNSFTLEQKQQAVVELNKQILLDKLDEQNNIQNKQENYYDDLKNDNQQIQQIIYQENDPQIQQNQQKQQQQQQFQNSQQEINQDKQQLQNQKNQQKTLNDFQYPFPISSQTQISLQQQNNDDIQELLSQNPLLKLKQKGIKQFSAKVREKSALLTNNNEINKNISPFLIIHFEEVFMIQDTANFWNNKFNDEELIQVRFRQDVKKCLRSLVRGYTIILIFRNNSKFSKNIFLHLFRNNYNFDAAYYIDDNCYQFTSNQNNKNISEIKKNDYNYTMGVNYEQIFQDFMYSNFKNKKNAFNQTQFKNVMKNKYLKVLILNSINNFTSIAKQLKNQQKKLEQDFIYENQGQKNQENLDSILIKNGMQENNSFQNKIPIIPYLNQKKVKIIYIKTIQQKQGQQNLNLQNQQQNQAFNLNPGFQQQQVITNTNLQDCSIILDITHSFMQKVYGNIGNNYNNNRKFQNNNINKKNNDTQSLISSSQTVQNSYNKVYFKQGNFYFFQLEMDNLLKQQIKNEISLIYKEQYIQDIHAIRQKNKNNKEKIEYEIDQKMEIFRDQTVQEIKEKSKNQDIKPPQNLYSIVADLVSRNKNIFNSIYKGNLQKKYKDKLNLLEIYQKKQKIIEGLQFDIQNLEKNQQNQIKQTTESFFSGLNQNKQQNYKSHQQNYNNNNYNQNQNQYQEIFMEDQKNYQQNIQDQIEIISHENLPYFAEMQFNQGFYLCQEIINNLPQNQNQQFNNKR